MNPRVDAHADVEATLAGQNGSHPGDADLAVGLGRPYTKCLVPGSLRRRKPTAAGSAQW